MLTLGSWFHQAPMYLATCNTVLNYIVRLHNPDVRQDTMRDAAAVGCIAPSFLEVKYCTYIWSKYCSTYVVWLHLSLPSPGLGSS